MKGKTNERLVSKTTSRFLTDDKDLREQPLSVGQYSRLLGEEVFCPIIRICFFFFRVSLSRKLL